MSTEIATHTGSRITIHRFDDPAALGAACATHLIGRITDQLGDGSGRFLLGCPGGRSALPVYSALADHAARAQPDWSGVVIVMMDDYLDGGPGVSADGAFHYVDADAHYSCRRFGRDDIVGRINAGLPPGCRIPIDNLWFPDPVYPEAYDRRIADAGGVDAFIVATGATDGHVAFNPPGSSPDGTTRIVKLGDETRHDNLKTFPDFASIDDVPTHGVSVGLGTIRTLSREVLCVVHGESKRTSVERILAAATPEADWPATILAACNQPSLWVTTDALPRP